MHQMFWNPFLEVSSINQLRLMSSFSVFCMKHGQTYKVLCHLCRFSQQLVPTNQQSRWPSSIDAKQTKSNQHIFSVHLTDNAQGAMRNIVFTALSEAGCCPPRICLIFCIFMCICICIWVYLFCICTFLTAITPPQILLAWEERLGASLHRL